MPGHGAKRSCIVLTRILYTMNGQGMDYLDETEQTSVWTRKWVCIVLICIFYTRNRQKMDFVARVLIGRITAFELELSSCCSSFIFYTRNGEVMD